MLAGAAAVLVAAVAVVLVRVWTRCWVLSAIKCPECGGEYTLEFHGSAITDWDKAIYRCSACGVLVEDVGGVLKKLP